MGKVTDRILWSILVLSIGVSLFIFGKPDLVSLTNQVLHHDDLKATMQTPSLSSVGNWHLQSTDSVNSGLSSHGYMLQSTKGITVDRLWNGDSYYVHMPDEVRQVSIPYNSYAKFLFKIKVSEPLTMMLDISNSPSDGSNWNNNDDDEFSRRQLIVDGKTTSIGMRSNQTVLSADTWHTVEIIYFNTDSANVHQVALRDRSVLDFINDNDHTVKFKLDNFRYAVDDQKYL